MWKQLTRTVYRIIEHNEVTGRNVPVNNAALLTVLGETRFNDILPQLS